MKITKSYLKQLIKEELGRMEEADEPYINPEGIDISPFFSEADKAMSELVKLAKDLQINNIRNPPDRKLRELYKQILSAISENPNNAEVIRVGITKLKDASGKNS